MGNRLEVSVDSGKYTLIMEQNGEFYANRYSDVKWRDLTGDGMVLALAQEIEKLKEENAELKKGQGK